MFASDYPHLEGGKDPLGSFDAFLANHNACTLDNFYVNNFRRVFGV
jgi:hypothetical protein